VDEPEPEAHVLYLLASGIWLLDSKSFRSDSTCLDAFSFGHTVYISDKGNTIAIASYYEKDRKGAVYVFHKRWFITTYWQKQVLQLANFESTNCLWYGSQVTISGDDSTLAVTAQYPSLCVFVYRSHNGLWQQEGPKWSLDTRCLSLALSSNGNTCVLEFCDFGLIIYNEA
jgi:hypothetical protein